MISPLFEGRTRGGSLRQSLLVFLGLQLLSIGVAIGSFSFFEERQVAALVAGSTFIIVEVWMMLVTLRWPKKLRYCVFYACRFNLWIFSLPMILVRARNWGHSFADVFIWGINGPTFHHMAEVSYTFMILLTFIDYLRVIKAKGASPTIPS